MTMSSASSISVGERRPAADSADEEEDYYMYDDDEFEMEDALQRQNSFEVIEHDNLLEEAQKYIDNIMSVCGIPTKAAAAALLRHTE